jgi:hypothetical protein
MDSKKKNLNKRIQYYYLQSLLDILFTEFLVIVYLLIYFWSLFTYYLFFEDLAIHVRDYLKNKTKRPINTSAWILMNNEKYIYIGARALGHALIENAFRARIKDHLMDDYKVIVSLSTTI